ncbi:MAG: ribosome maturation factor RimP [Eubacteriales bacterium]|nr:ribosome maturation factor RimP [Eubacteriales bacterium]
MGNTGNYEERTEALLQPFMEEEGLTIEDIEFVRENDWFLRIYIDKPGGVTIEDCEKVSRYIDPLLDRADFIRQSYILEVSSPGLSRPLKKDRQLRRHIGDVVEVKLYRALDGEKSILAVLSDFDSEYLMLDTLDGRQLSIERSTVAQVKLSIDL